MRFWDFFKSKKNLRVEPAEVNDTPSPEQQAFADEVIAVLSPTVKQYGFTLITKQVKEYSTKIVYAKGRQYIQVSSTSYPTDYPYYYNIIFGEGDSDNFRESDWNSVALWHIAQVVNPQSQITEYKFPVGDSIKYSVAQANKHLINYGETFFNGDLALFYEARKMINDRREPYKIYTPNKDGSYNVNIDTRSEQQKKKYS